MLLKILWKECREKITLRPNQDMMIFLSKTSSPDQESEIFLPSMKTRSVVGAPSCPK